LRELLLQKLLLLLVVELLLCDNVGAAHNVEPSI